MISMESESCRIIAKQNSKRRIFHLHKFWRGIFPLWMLASTRTVRLTRMFFLMTKEGYIGKRKPFKRLGALQSEVNWYSAPGK